MNFSLFLYELFRGKPSQNLSLEDCASFQKREPALGELQGRHSPPSYESSARRVRMRDVSWEDGMILLQNASIERPERVYEIDMVVFGTLNRLAMQRTIKVLAQTAQGARRICRSRYSRCEIRSTRAIKTQPAWTCLELFAATGAASLG
jgi:hypothetical protein